MYKMPIHKKILSIFIVLSIIIFWYWQCFAVDILDKSLNKIEKNIDDASNKKPVAKDLYNTYLNKSQYTQLDAVSQTVSDLKWLINDRYMCNLKDKDIINILYYGSTGFKRDVDTLTIPSIEKPSTGDAKSSCAKFNICVWSSNWQVWEVSTYWCIPKVSSLYEDVLSNKKSVSTLTEKVKWNEYFWNGSLDDSTFDLLVDVYDIAKILFGEDESVPPPETVFFEMPQLDNVDGVYAGDDTSTIVDRFSPYNTTVSSNNGTSNSNNNTSSNNWNNVNQWQASQWNGNANSTNSAIGNTNKPVNATNTSIEQWMDVDIMNFIQTVNTVEVKSENYATSSVWNQCVSGFSYQYKTWYTITDTGVISVTDTIQEDITQEQIEEYVEYTLNQIQSLQCNNDYVCESREARTCPDCLPMWSGSDVLSEVADLINSIDFWDSDEVVSPQTAACMNNCWQTQNTVESKLLCVAKCFCTTYESTLFNPEDFPWMSPVFTLKMCVMPVANAQYQKQKKVKDIQSVFEELYNLVTELKNGWSTMPAVKTKTYLDSSYMQNSFWKSISFLITSNTKKHTSQKSQKTKEKTQENTNTQLMTNIAWFSQDPAMDSEKNKYVVAWEKYESKWEEISKVWDSLHESLQNEIIIGVDSQFEKFMQLNSNFWKEVREVLKEFNEQSRELSTKK